MAQAKFYVDDEVTLKAKPSQIGVVERTISEVSSHYPRPTLTYPEGIKREKGISKPAFREFLKTGIPPKGAVLVSWSELPWQVNLPCSLLLEADINLVERSLMKGDVVKSNAQDAMSGTVIDVLSKVELVNPVEWPKPRASSETPQHSDFGCFDPDPQRVVRHVSVSDLEPVNSYEAGRLVVCRNWIGVITGAFEDVHVRLADGNVVVVADAEELEPAHSEGEIGTFVTTKKGNLRRGKWIFGAFNPNTAPEGYIAGINSKFIEVAWLCQKYPLKRDEIGDAPDDETFEPDDFLNGDIRFYPFSACPEQTADTETPRPDAEIQLGQFVRFRDLHAYIQHPTNTTDSKPNFIPRVSTLGYDTNVFIVSRMSTTVTIRWQDLSITKQPSTSLVPFLDLDDEDELWPGELVTTREQRDSEEPMDVFYPKRIGIVQSVRASDRMAKVRWFSHGNLKFVGEDHDTLLPGGVTGTSLEAAEDVSLYDIWTLGAIHRRLGDIVALSPIDDQSSNRQFYDQTVLENVHNASLSEVNTYEWFGEVTELGLNGLLTVRLGLASHVRDIQVPWECTTIAHSPGEDSPAEFDGDLDEDTDYLDSDEDMSDVSEDFAPRALGALRTDLLGQGWLDEQDQTVEDKNDENEWTTDDEMSDVNDDVPSVDTSPPTTEPTTVSAQPLGGTAEAFDYTNMFTAGNEPAKFSILDGQVPGDHYFLDTDVRTDRTRLARIMKEHKVLQNSLPDGVYVRTWEGSLNFLRVLILGPLDTPYEYAPFMFDIHLDSSFPAAPPQMFFHSWTEGNGAINPNLYEDGKICLSLLGTWAGDENHETWSEERSSLLQILVSILGLVLVREPFYNEAGYEVRAGSSDSVVPSRLYSERTYFRSRGFIHHALEFPPSGFEEEVQNIYLREDSDGPHLLIRAIQSSIEVIWRSQTPTELDGTAEPSHIRQTSGPERRLSVGAIVPLRRQVESLINRLASKDEESAAELKKMLEDRLYVPRGKVAEIAVNRRERR